MSESVVATIMLKPPVTTPEILSKTVEYLQKSQAPSLVSEAGLLFDADLIPQQIAAATLHIFSGKLTGQYITNIKNSGLLPILRTSINHGVTEEQTRQAIFSNFTQSVGLMGRGATYGVKTNWEVRGLLEVLWALINIFFTGSATVTEKATINAFGLSKQFNIRARVPVKSVNVAWD